jgi:pimeloyl-ACP methyl ester carboxylesterase
MPPVYFTDSGKGFPVVLLHGFCETHEIWSGVISHLQSSWRVLAVDLPGFGKSNPPAIPDSLDDAADLIISWLDSIHIRKCVMLGHSLGGYVTLAVADKKPELLAAFGLIHSTAYADSEEKKANRNRVIDFVQQHGVSPFIESFIPPLFANPQHAQISKVVAIGKTTPPETLVAYTRAMRDRPDRTSVLAGFAGKILLLAGEFDNLIPVASIEEQARYCQQPVVAVLQGVAHMGMLENEAETVSVLRVFLNEAVGQPDNRLN